MTKRTQDPVQLQQKLIHVQSELKKEQERIERFKQTYNHQLIEELRQENIKLQEELTELEEHLMDLEKKLETYKRQFDVSNIKVKMYQNAWEKVENEKQQVQKGYQVLEEQYGTLNNQLLTLKTEQRQQEMIIKEKNDLIKKLELKHASKNHQINQLTEQSQSLLNERDYYVSQTTELKGKHFQLEALFKQVLLTHLARQLSNIRGQLIDSKMNHSQREQLIMALENRLEEISKDIVLLEEKN